MRCFVIGIVLNKYTCHLRDPEDLHSTIYLTVSCRVQKSASGVLWISQTPMQIAFCNGSYEDMVGAWRACLFLFIWLAPSSILELALYLSLSRFGVGMARFGQASQVCLPHCLSLIFSRNNPHLLLPCYDREKSMNSESLSLIPFYIRSPIHG